MINIPYMTRFETEVLKAHRQAYNYPDGRQGLVRGWKTALKKYTATDIEHALFCLLHSDFDQSEVLMDTKIWGSSYSQILIK